MDFYKFIRTLIITIATILFLAGVYSVGYKMVYRSVSVSRKVLTTQDDPLPSILKSIQHKGKLVVTDANVAVNTLSRVDSDLWDATVTSSATGRVQIYLDLNYLRPEWVKQTGDTINVLIPNDSVKYEVIPTGETHKGNGSWGFTVHPSYLHQLKDKNHNDLKQRLDAEGDQLREDNISEVEIEVKRLFMGVLGDRHMTVNVSVSD
jgi:hypothetical protein